MSDSHTDPDPDPDLQIAVVATFSLQTAHIVAGRLQADGIRCMVAPSGGEMGPWTAEMSPGVLIGAGTPAMGLAPLGGGGRASDILVEVADLEAAREILRQRGYKVPRDPV